MAHLVTWLQDHHALTVAAAEVARRTLRENRDEPWTRELELLGSYLDRERQLLEQLLSGLGRGPSRVKSTLGWVAEKLGRFKLNGRLVSYSPLSRLEEAEGLLLAVTSLAVLWRSLDGLDLEGVARGVDPSLRVREAEAQLDRLRTLLSLAAPLAIAPPVEAGLQ